MVKSIKYKDGYTMEEMVMRVNYWWIRYQGTHTEEGKEFSKSDVKMLSSILNELAENPNTFQWSNPDMGVEF